jgi:aminomethyltransferase
MQRLTEVNLAGLRPFRFLQNVEVAGMPVLLSRTGYTGEDGFELCFSLDRVDAVRLWETLLREGEREQIKPCGLGARDTLRFEVCLPLYGQELNETITPLEAGLGFVVKWDKNFIGKAALLRQKEAGLRRRLAGIELVDRGIPRHGYTVSGLAQGTDDTWRAVGTVTSGTQSPTLKKSIALALIDAGYWKTGTPLKVEIRGKQAAAKVVDTPFYKRTGS